MTQRPSTNISADEFWGREFERWKKSRYTPRQDELSVGEETETGALYRIPLQTLQRHLYIIGESGCGKSKFIESLVEQDITQGNGIGIIDPHGDLIDHIKGFVASRYHSTQDEELLDRIILVDPMHPTSTVTFNPLEPLPNTSASDQASELVSVFHKIWSDSWGPQMEDLMRNSFIALGEAGLTLVDLPLFYRDASFRAGVMERVSHPIARYFFEDEFDSRSESARAQRVSPVRNKINAFLSNDKIRQMLSFPKSSFNLREIMDTRKILLINLDSGQLKDASKLLGSLFMSKIKMSAFSRTDIPERQRVPFRLYVDEFGNFATEEFAIILAEARKYALSLVMAHQDFTQISASLKGAVLGNATARVCFRVNRSDAEQMSKELFEYAQDEVKRTRPLKSGEISYTYRSSGEQRELLTQQIHHLPDRVCYVNNKLAREVTRIRTLDVTPASKALGMSEERADEYIEQLSIGRKYLVERSKIEQQAVERSKTHPAPQNVLNKDERALLHLICTDSDVPESEVYKSIGVGMSKGYRLRDTLKVRGLITDELTVKLKSRGRPSKILVPTAEAYELLGMELPPGRGGAIHVHVQQMIEDNARSKGYEAQREKTLANGGRVDVHLEKDGHRVAVEVAVVSKPEREISHITNCLEADYDRIITVFVDERLLAKTQQQLAESLSAEQLTRVTLLSVKQLGKLL